MSLLNRLISLFRGYEYLIKQDIEAEDEAFWAVCEKTNLLINQKKTQIRLIGFGFRDLFFIFSKLLASIINVRFDYDRVIIKNIVVHSKRNFRDCEGILMKIKARILELNEDKELLANINMNIEAILEIIQNLEALYVNYFSLIEVEDYYSGKKLNYQNRVYETKEFYEIIKILLKNFQDLRNKLNDLLIIFRSMCREGYGTI